MAGGILDNNSKTIATDNRIDLSGAGSTAIRIGNKNNLAPIYKVGKSGTLTINNGDPNAAAATQNLLGSVLTKFESQQNVNSANYAALQEGQTGLLDKVLGSLKDLSLSKQTDGKSGDNKTVLYVVIAIVIGVVVYFWD